MSKASNWLPLFVGDYLADTAHLSTQEHGAYLLLLMHQWRNGAIPDDEKQIARIVRASPSEWRKMAETITFFFTKTDEGWVQKRLERERARADDLADKRSDKGRKAAISRWKGDATSMHGACSEHEPSIAQAMPKQCPLPLPIPLPEEGDTSLRSVSPARGKRAATDSHFADFWAAYPRKVGRGAAEKAFAAAIAKGATVADIAAGLNRQTWPPDPRFIPHPATWINQSRWQDDPAASAPPPVQPATPGKLDWMWDEMRGKSDAADEFPDFSAAPRSLVQ